MICTAVISNSISGHRGKFGTAQDDDDRRRKWPPSAATPRILAKLAWAPNVGGPTIVPRTFTAEDLPNIVLTEENAPAGFTVDDENPETGAAALTMPFRPGGDTIDTTAFVDALSITGGDDVGGYTTWAALFETPEAASDAFELVATEHDSPDG